MKITGFLLIATPVVLGCTNLSVRDSQTETALAQVQIEQLKTHAQAIDLIGGAKESRRVEPQKLVEACQIFTVLAKDSSYLLRDIAILRSRTLCADRSNLPIFDDNSLKTSNWLRSLNLERKLQELGADKAAGKNVGEELARVYFQKALLMDRPKEKLLTLQAALSELENPNPFRQEVQGKIEQVAPRLISNPQPQDYSRIASDLIQNRDFVNGRKYLKAIFTNTKLTWTERLSARKLYRNSFKIEQNREAYFKETRHFVLWVGNELKSRRPGSLQTEDWKLLHDAYVTSARAAWTLGDTPMAQKILHRALGRLEGRWPGDEIHWILGRIEEEKAQWQKALDEYKISLQLTAPNSSLRDRVLFSQFWMLRKLGKFREAIAAGQQLKASTQDPFDVNRFSFWLARSYQDAGLTVDARNEFNLLKATDALGYYGMMAYYELGEDLPPLPQNNGNLNLKALDKEQRRQIQALTLANEQSILENYLNEKIKALKDPRMNIDVQLAYLKAYAAAGLYLPLFSLIGTVEPSVRARLLEEHPDFLFPKKYSELIDTAASRFHVSPELMLAIIRQESAFNTFARSGADAFGLMQILPRVAKEQESITGIRLKSHEDLYEPEINIISGAALLSQLGKKYRGQLILEAAAYNASEQAIENWLKTRMRDDTLEFIEDIPYEETRGYIKLVLRNYIFYSRLRQPQTPLPFPKACLENLNTKSYL